MRHISFILSLPTRATMCLYMYINISVVSFSLGQAFSCDLQNGLEVEYSLAAHSHK